MNIVVGSKAPRRGSKTQNDRFPSKIAHLWKNVISTLTTFAKTENECINDRHCHRTHDTYNSAKTDNPCSSGVTGVGDTRGGNLGCHPSIFF